MGEFELRREQRGDQHLVFAILPSGHAVWGMDLVTRQEWWYAPEYEAALSPAIHARTAALAPPDAAHAAVARYATAAAPAPEPAMAGAPVNLATHRPGHAVLAQIAAKHTKATASMLDGSPGVLDDDIVQWCVGYVGEEVVGGLLEGLGPGWKVLHSVPVGTSGADIDHVVIGPGGVFAINTKHHAGQTVDVKGDAVFIAGAYQHYIQKARLEAERTTTVLQRVAAGQVAYPVIAVVGGTVKVKEAPAGVYVMNSAALTSWLLGLPPVLTHEQVAEVYAAMRVRTNWTAVAPPTAAPDWVADFARQLSHDRAASRTKSRQPAESRGGARGDRQKGRGPKGRTDQRVPTTSNGRRRGKKSRGIGEELARLVAGLAVLGLMIWGLPVLVQNLTDKAKQRQQTTVAEIPVVVPGSGCTERGAEAATPSGTALVCARVKGSTVLRWQAS